MGKDGPVHTPQVFPFLSRIYPFSPHASLQEFLMIQYSSEEPTKNTAWLSLVSQLSKMPDAYKCQLVASTLTAMGLLWSVVSISEQLAIYDTPKVLYVPVGVLQSWFTAM